MEQEYEWVNVTKECKIDRILFSSEGTISGICVTVNPSHARLLNIYFICQDHFSTSLDYRARTTPNGSFIVERRVPVESETVDITVEGKTITISRLSDPIAFAVVRGLVK